MLGYVLMEMYVATYNLIKTHKFIWTHIQRKKKG